MYNILPAKYYRANPWDISFEDRLSKLLEAYKNGFKIVVYLYEQADTSTFRYRVYNMCQVLDESDKWTGVYFFENELVQLEKYMDKINVIIIARFKWSFILDKFLYVAKRKNIKLAFDVDDLVYDSKYIPIITNTLAVDFRDESDYSFWFEYTSRIGTTAKLCDYIISTNQYIANHLSSDLDKKCYIMKNYFNREQDQISDFFAKQKENHCNVEPKFVIGYFSGTPSHINDFLVVAPEIRDLLYKYDDISLRIVGFMELPKYMKELQSVGKIEIVPLQNFLDLQQKIAEVDVNIIPLFNNDFTNCKSELKYFEAAIVNTVSCATPTYVYKNIIENGINGYLCNQGEWYKTIEKLYLDGISENVLENAKALTMEKYAYYNQLINLENILDDFI